jgi:hypothetical protein
MQQKFFNLVGFTKLLRREGAVEKKGCVILAQTLVEIMKRRWD